MNPRFILLLAAVPPFFPHAVRIQRIREPADCPVHEALLVDRNAGVADDYVVFATTDPEAGSRGITCLRQMIEPSFGERQ